MTSASGRAGLSAGRKGAHQHMQERHSFLRNHAMARAIAMALSASVGGLFVMPVTAQTAQTATQQHAYHIPASRLGKALDDLGTQGNVQIAYAPALVNGKSSLGLSGDFTPTEALRRILRGTGLTWKAVGASAFVIEPQQPTHEDRNKQTDKSKKNDQAQINQKNAQELATVLVTGSHIRRVELETANPVLRVGQDVIKANGAMDLGELMQSLPMMTGSAENPQHHGGTGKTELSLRGMGHGRTLILVDGHRVISNDVSSIFAPMIDHVEVLTNGGSAVYGSDAIGGVVNFITKKNYEGAQFTARYGVSSHHDGIGKGYRFIFGNSSDKGSIFAGIGYSINTGVRAKDRWYTKNSIELTGVNPDGSLETSVGGSTSSPFGRIQIPDSGPVHEAWKDCDSGNLARNPDASGLDPINDYHCYINSGPNSDKYNFATETQARKPIERTHVFLLGHHDLTKNTSVYLDAYYSKYTAVFTEAAATYHTPSVEIPANNYWNPFGVDFGSDGYSFRSRLTAVGDRGADYTHSFSQVYTGIKGHHNIFGQRWDWDVGLNYGHDHYQHLIYNYPNTDLLWTGPSFLDNSTGEVVCGTPDHPISDCDASFNPFNMQAANSIKAAHKASTSAMLTSYQQQKIWHARASGGIFDLPAGTVQLALGALYRQNRSHTAVGGLLLMDSDGDCSIGTNCTSPSQSSHSAKVAYAELLVPLLANRPWAYGLNLTVGDRYSRFSTFGSTTTKAFAVEWRPTRNLLLRGSVDEVFRAPSVGDVSGSIHNADPKISFDPCDGYTGNPVDPACVNVPTDGSFVDSYVAQGVETAIRSGGAKAAGFAIQPESGKSFDIGAVYSPLWAQGLTITVDQWHIYLDDIITTVGLQNILYLCSAGQLVYCPLISRHPSGPQQGQLDRNTMETTGNLGTVSTGGTDISAGYRLDTNSLGRFKFKINGTYLKYYNAQTAPGTPANVTFHYAGHFMGVGSAPASSCPGEGQCLFPRWKANGFVLWNLGNWSATWRVKYIGGFRMGSPDPTQDTHPAGNDLDGFYLDYGSRIYHDVSLIYDIKPLHTRIKVGVKNLFGVDPPLVYENNASYGQASMAYDLVGRYYWARLVVDF